MFGMHTSVMELTREAVEKGGASGGILIVTQPDNPPFQVTVFVGVNSVGSKMVELLSPLITGAAITPVTH